MLPKLLSPERNTSGAEPILRHPEKADGAGVWRAVRDAGTLDLNSSYAYLLLCDRFADTSVVAEFEGEVVGFVMGFIPPRSPHVHFVWQVGVSSKMRGYGLGRSLLERAVAGEACRDVTHMETTITPSNEASDALFRSFARSVGAEVEVSAEDGFPAEIFPDGKEAELLYRIGPMDRNRLRRQS